MPTMDVLTYEADKDYFDFTCPWYEITTIDLLEAPVLVQLTATYDSDWNYVALIEKAAWVVNKLIRKLNLNLLADRPRQKQSGYG